MNTIDSSLTCWITKTGKIKFGGAKGRAFSDSGRTWSDTSERMSMILNGQYDRVNVAGPLGVFLCQYASDFIVADIMYHKNVQYLLSIRYHDESHCELSIEKKADIILDHAILKFNAFSLRLRNGLENRK